MTEPTTNEVINHLVDMKGDLGKMQGVLETVATAHNERLENVENDVGSLKRWRTYVVGIGTTIAALFGISSEL